MPPHSKQALPKTWASVDEIDEALFQIPGLNHLRDVVVTKMVACCMVSREWFVVAGVEKQKLLLMEFKTNQSIHIQRHNRRRNDSNKS